MCGAGQAQAGGESLPHHRGLQSFFLRLDFLRGRCNSYYAFFGLNEPKASDQGLVALFARLFAR